VGKVAASFVIFLASHLTELIVMPVDFKLLLCFLDSFVFFFSLNIIILIHFLMRYMYTYHLFIVWIL